MKKGKKRDQATQPGRSSRLQSARGHVRLFPLLAFQFLSLPSSCFARVTLEVLVPKAGERIGVQLAMIMMVTHESLVLFLLKLPCRLLLPACVLAPFVVGLP